MLYNLVEGSVDVPSGSIGYVSFGHGERHLIMIQGLNVRDLKGAGASLALMYKMFSRNYRVWFFDRRATVAEGLTIFDLAEDIYHAMRALSIDSADILGVSQGGMIAMALALEHPECTRKMVLAVTAARANENIKKVVGGWVYHARKRDSISINKETFSLMYTEQYLRKYKLLMPLLVRLVKPHDFDRFAILAESILDFDCLNRLQEIACPVLVIGGAQDRIVTPEASLEIADRLGCEIHMYDDYGHAAYEEAKDFNRRVYEFLSE